MSIEATGAQPRSNSRFALASLAALGVVFGDIGTSPLYTLKTVLDYTGPHPDPAAVLGALSLILWTLVLIVTVKYVNFAMRVDNDGEGGVIALMTLLGVKKHQRPIIVAVGLFGAALIYGDGAITPAISVLSALEGVEQIAPALQTYVLPAATAILLALFAVQPLGTAAIGRAFGPIMLAWFIIIAALGVYGILQHPQVVVAIDPRYGLDYLSRGGYQGFLVLGGVFLCVTGAEALYADMGHFGPGPIRLSWSAVVFPALILNYAGQAAIVLAGAPTDGNIFYRLCPEPLLTPLIVLATIATVIASQSIITGAFSMTRQAIQLGWLPRMTIKQTSEEGYGQIYVGAVNWLLMIVDSRPYDRLRQVRQSRRGLWHRGLRDNAHDRRAFVHRHARDLELAGRRGGGGRGLFHRHRRRLFRRQYGQSDAGRLGAAAARLRRLWRNVDLAPRRHGGTEAGRVGGDAAFHVHRAPSIRQSRARARLGGVLHSREGPNSSGPRLACAPQPRPA